MGKLITRPQEQHSFLDTAAPGEYPVPLGAEPQQCRSCGAAIVWGKTSTDRAVPLDLAHLRVIDGQRYAVTHFAYCPHGPHWRTKR
jgi:hypothetical protein